MSTTPNPVSMVFDAARAEAYDTQCSGAHALRDAAHLLIAACFSRLPQEASILVAGAGTGAEVRYLAPRFPGWRFTLVDPSAPMLAVARRHAEAAGFADRCTFHADYVSATPLEAHDGATSLLVSHFLTEAAARQSFFEDIAARLKPGSPLFTLDLCTDDDAPSFEGVMGLWLDLLKRGGVPEENLAAYTQAYGRDFSAHGPAELEALISAAGFIRLTPVFQAALMKGWTAVRR